MKEESIELSARAAAESGAALPAADDYARLASVFERLEPQQCSGHVFRTRCHVAEQLRAAQASPDHPQNVALLRAARLLLPPEP